VKIEDIRLRTSASSEATYFFETSSYDLNSTFNSMISNVNIKNSSLMFLKLGGVTNQNPLGLTKTFTLDRIFISSISSPTITSLINFENIDTSEDLVI